MSAMNVAPHLYDHSNVLQRRDASILLPLIIKDAEDRNVRKIVDIGCGSGNITAKLADALPGVEIVGVDYSGPMIEYAKLHYDRANIKYVLGDICKDYALLEQAVGSTNNIDMVVSFYCLHWVESKLTAMNHIEKLLSPGGKTYLIAFGWSDILPVCQEITQEPKWFKYFIEENPTEVTNFPDIFEQEHVQTGRPARRPSKGLPPFSCLKKPTEAELLNGWKSLCERAGFKVESVSLTKANMPYSEYEDFQNEITSVCHLLPYIPEAERKEFLDDLFVIIDKKYINQQGDENEKGDNQCSTQRKRAILFYDYLTIIGQKA